MTKKKEGKIFEDCVTASCPKYIFVKKLADNASGWSGGAKSCFATSNECDFIMHDEQTGLLYGLELKSTKESSVTFWREDFEKKNKERGIRTHYIIGKKQILGLKKWSEKHKGIFGFIINFRNSENETFFVSISDFLSFTDKFSKPRISIRDIVEMGGVRISSKKAKVNYKYDMDTFFKEMAETL